MAEKASVVPHKVQHPSFIEFQRGESMQCTACRNGQLIRAKRKGFLEKNIYSLFGYYPWKCKTCKYRALLRLRRDPLAMYESRNDVSRKHDRPPVLKRTS